MNMNDIRALLPFYAANSLSGDERAAVELALEDSAELRKELEFWVLAKHATAVHAELTSGDHLSSEDIVAYARGGAIDMRAKMEEHLQGCASCRRDLDVIRQLQSHGKTPQPQRMTFSLAWVFRYAIPGFALLVAGFFVYRMFESDRSNVPVVSEVPPMDTLVITNPPARVKHIPLALQLTTAMRDVQARKPPLPVLLLDSLNSIVDISFSLQHSAIAEGYAIILVGPQEKPVELSALQQAKPSGENLDIVTLSVDGSRFAEPGRYVFHVREVLKKEATGIEPEEYRYNVDVRYR